MSETLPALKAQADELGITYANNIGEDTLQKKIDEALGNFDGSDTPELTKDTASQPDDNVTVRLQEDETNKHDLPLGVNGKTYLLKRGEDVSVPRDVYEVLKDCVEDHYDGDGNKTRRQSYPFTVVV